MKKNVGIFGLILVGLVVLNCDARLFGRRVISPSYSGTCVPTGEYKEVDKVGTTKSILVTPVSSTPATKLVDRFPNCPDNTPKPDEVDEVNPVILQQANEIAQLKADLAKMQEILNAPEPVEESTDSPWAYVVAGLAFGLIVTVIVKFRDLKYGK